MIRTAIVLACVAACSSAPPPRHIDRTVKPTLKAGARTLTIIGTNDLHGALDRLPLFGGFVANIRAAREADGGSVLLLDAGDMFQGTLESNLAEGTDVVRAYNELKYDAVCVGNHEFDFGPEGALVTPKSIEDDPRGALKLRATEAKFPFLVSNIVDKTSGNRIKWPNMPASLLVERAGTMIGIIGAATEQTPFTTMAANFVGPEMSPTAVAIPQEARPRRDKGAQIIVVVAHIGTACTDVEHPTDISSCDQSEEVFHVISDLPKGLVDVWVGGHTHARVAHRINDVAVIESLSSGRAFGRVDIPLTATHVRGLTIHKPVVMCPLDKDENAIAATECHPEPYEGRPVTPEASVQAIVADAQQRASKLRDEQLGPTLLGVVTKQYSSESAEGNWVTDLMLLARPEAQVSLTNGGGLRADVPAGPLTYGRLYEMMPFDNRFALVDIKGKHIRRLITSNLLREKTSGFNTWGGLTVKARCKAGTLDVEIKVAGKPLADDATYKLVTSDFLASNGDGLIGRLKLPEGSIKLTDVIIRDAIADVLRKRKGRVDPAQLYSPTHRRFDFEGERPVQCGSKQQPTQREEPD